MPRVKQLKVSGTYSLTPSEIRKLKANAKKGKFKNVSRFIASQCIHHYNPDSNDV